MTAMTQARRKSLLGSGSAQFAGQFLGLLLAILVSHLIARRMGVGPQADAFLLGRRLITAVTEALNQIVVAVFIPLIAAQAAAGAGIWHIIMRSGGGALLAGTALAAVFIAGAPWIVASVAPQFDAQTAALATRVMRILSLALPATVATVALAAYCNVREQFGGAAASRQLPRAAVAAALLLGTGGLAELAAGAYTFGAVLVTGMLLLMALRLSRTAPIQTGIRRSGSVSRRAAAAVVLAGGAMVVLWLETAFAAWTGPGGVAMLEYSQRLGALLGNTLAMALTLVVFADLSRRSAAGETRELDARFNIAVWAGISLMLPVTVGVVVNAPGIIELVLGYGAFEAAEIRAEVVTLTRWMAVAPLGALVVRMLYVRVLADDTLPVVRIALVATIADMVIRAVLFRILVPWLGLTGIPLSLVITPIGPVLIIALWLRRQNVFLDLRPASISRPLMATSLTASLAIAAGAWLGPLLSQWTALDGKSAALSGLLVSGLAGSAVLGVAVTAFRVRLR